MNVKDFEYLVAIERNRSITKASQELFISQPALSKFLKRMDQEAGTKLFQSIGKALVPTLAGEFCIERAKEILHVNDQINNRINDIAKLKLGRIRVGLPMSRTDYFLAQILPLFYQKYPGIQIIIVENAAANLIQKVSSGELDFIYINYVKENHQGFLNYEIIAEEEMVLAVPIKYHLEKNAYILNNYLYPCLPPESWVALPYIMLSQDQATRSFTNQYFRKNKITPQVILEIRNLAQAVNAVHHGLGVTITPSILSGKKNNIRYFSLPTEDGPSLRKTAVVYRTDTYLSKAEQDLIQIIKQSN